MIIAKGQGNFEGLIDVNHNTYFMLVAKCDLVVSRLRAKMVILSLRNIGVINEL